MLSTRLYYSEQADNNMNMNDLYCLMQQQ